MEVVKQNRKRRSEESVSSTTTVANLTTTVANSMTTVAYSTSTSATDRTTFSDVLCNGTRNLLTLAKLDPVTSASSASSTHHPQSVDSQLVRKLTAEESHMLIDLNQVSKILTRLTARFNVSEHTTCHYANAVTSCSRYY